MLFCLRLKTVTKLQAYLYKFIEVELCAEVIQKVKARSNADWKFYSRLCYLYLEDGILKIMETIQTVH